MKNLIVTSRILAILLFSVWIISCKTKESVSKAEISSDTVLIVKGQKVFSDNCSSCHGFNQDAIGPQLGGLTTLVSSDWIKGFIKNPQQVIQSGDERAQLLFDRYKLVMPSFSHLKEDEVESIVAFINTKKAPNRTVKNADDPNALRNPIPEPIPMSDLVVEMEPITQIPASSQEGQLTRICKLDFRPDTKELFVVDLRGKLYKLDKDNKPILYLDLAEKFPKFINTPGLATGFGSFAFHPDFAKNGLLYTSHSEGPGSAPADFAYNDSIKVTLQWVLTEWKTNKPGVEPFEGKGREMFRVNMVQQIHGMQELTFNKLSKPGDDDYGLLYVGIGDGGAVETGFPFLAHSTEKIWGTVIRIDPTKRNSKNGKYGIPSSNPFVKKANKNTVTEIYAYGFRNPHRISWTQAGQMMVSNIGHHNIESLYWVLPGHDHGWHIREGAFVIDATANMFNVFTLPPGDSTNVSYPVAQYDHDEGNAISGGFEYTGSLIPELKGKYLFGDIVKGRLFYIELSEMKQGSQTQIYEWQVSLNGKKALLTDLCGAKKVDLRFGRDSKGEIYILTKPDGKIYRLQSVAKSIT
jgi:mono/diheme cytochrome c family protein